MPGSPDHPDVLGYPQMLHTKMRLIGKKLGKSSSTVAFAFVRLSSDMRAPAGSPDDWGNSACIRHRVEPAMCPTTRPMPDHTRISVAAS